jgi:hypothetical protein
MNEAKGFARFIIIHTEEVNTIGACRRYKGQVYNVDELYDIYQSLTKKS